MFSHEYVLVLLAMLMLSTKLVSARNVNVEEESGIYEEYYIDTPTEVRADE